MTDRLDTLLTTLAATPADMDLSRLEPAVWARLAPADGGLPLAGWRLPALSALLALLVGAVASTAMAAPSPAEISAFSPSIALAPSTLLEVGR